MPQVIDEYIQRLRRLHTDQNPDTWPNMPGHRAPHKPLLLLAVLELIEEGLIEEGLIGENRIDHSPELVEAFARYWACVPTGRQRGKAFLPFFHLRFERFWHLVAQPGMETVLANTRTVRSPAHLRRLVQHARLDEELFVLLTLAESRQRLREALVEAYFDVPTQSALMDQATVSPQAFVYSRTLLEVAPRIAERPRGEEYLPAVRDQGFRRAVVVAYERRCGLCGIRILTVEGHTAVDAAHIVPWSVTHDDRPANGMALCRLCHWAFDEGVLGVGQDYTVLTARELSADSNLPAHLGTLKGREMIRPRDEAHWPDLEALAWHHQEVFRTR